MAVGCPVGEHVAMAVDDEAVPGLDEHRRSLHGRPALLLVVCVAVVIVVAAVIAISG